MLYNDRVFIGPGTIQRALGLRKRQPLPMAEYAYQSQQLEVRIDRWNARKLLFLW